jgi:hypothetical protein
MMYYHHWHVEERTLLFECCHKYRSPRQKVQQHHRHEVKPLKWCRFLIKAWHLLWDKVLLKATCLQMSRNISIKSNLRKMYKMYYDVRKSKKFQDSRNILHIMCGKCLIFQYLQLYFYCVTYAVKTIYAYFDYFFVIYVFVSAIDNV